MIRILLLVLLTTRWLAAAPLVENQFPITNVMLGQPLDWTITVGHAYWETYRLQLQPCPGTEMQITQQKTLERQGGLNTTFVVRIAPVSLSVPETPRGVLVDSHDRATPIIGRPIQVHVISGSSVELRDPEIPQFPSTRTRRNFKKLFTGIALLLLSGSYLLLRRLRSPRHVLRRRLSQMLRQVRTSGALEAGTLLRVLRSSLLWGFDAAPLSVAELQEKAQANPHLKTMAAAMVRIEQDRYAGALRKPQRAAAEASLAAALTLVKGR